MVRIERMGEPHAEGRPKRGAPCCRPLYLDGHDGRRKNNVAIVLNAPKTLPPISAPRGIPAQVLVSENSRILYQENRI